MRSSANCIIVGGSRREAEVVVPARDLVVAGFIWNGVRIASGRGQFLFTLGTSNGYWSPANNYAILVQDRDRAWRLVNGSGRLWTAQFRLGKKALDARSCVDDGGR